MDRIGIFAVGAALVMMSALHMANAPTWLVAVPVALLAAGGVRLMLARNADDAAPELAPSSASEI